MAPRRIRDYRMSDAALLQRREAATRHGRYAKSGRHIYGQSPPSVIFLAGEYQDGVLLHYGLMIGRYPLAQGRPRIDRSGNPRKLRIIGERVGDLFEEQRIRDRFRTTRIRGRWYRWDSFLLQEFGLSIPDVPEPEIPFLQVELD